MNPKKRRLPILLPACGICILILDNKTAIIGASEGITLCMQSVIPSLFPFLMLSALLTSLLVGQKIPLMGKVTKLCGLPKNAEALFLIGLLGGYPVGAQVITEAYSSGHLTKNTAHRLLGFCSNAGPAFIFGIAGCLFSKPWMPWFLWLIHVLSALIVGTILPGKTESQSAVKKQDSITVNQAFTRSLHIMASICGWIILFRVLITLLNRWFIWLIPKTVGILIAGCLELTNGIFMLKSVSSEAAKLILCSVFLSFGGACVAMQTASVTKSLGMGMYLSGKILQSSISCALSAFLGFLIYQSQNAMIIFSFSSTMSFIIAIIIRINKNTVAFLKTSMYNSQKSLRELPVCSFGRK